MNKPNKKLTAWILSSILLLSFIASIMHIVLREPAEKTFYKELETQTIPDYTDDLIVPLVIKALEDDNRTITDYIGLTGENMNIINEGLLQESNVIYKDWFRNRKSKLLYSVHVKGNQEAFTNTDLDLKQEAPTKYLWYIHFAFDENGTASILHATDNILKSSYLSRLDYITQNFLYQCYDYDVENEITSNTVELKNVEVTFAIPKNISLNDPLFTNSVSPYAYLIMINAFVLIGMLIIGAIVSFFLPKRWALESAGIRKLMKLPIECLIILIACFYFGGFMIYGYTYDFYQYSYIQTMADWLVFIQMLFGALMWAYNFLAILFVYVLVSHIKQIADYGFVGYLKQYSCFVRIPHYLYHKIKNIDIHDKGTRYIAFVIAVNFIAMVILIRKDYYVYTSTWISLLVINLIYYFIAISIYHKIQKNYRDMRNALTDIAKGDFKEPEVHDLGIYENMNESIEEIRIGFKDAVEKEVKSQKMKTELITNVSHDLKTPLTSIVSYVDLLKNSNASEEEKEQYLDILEVNSKRLKYLIEDLFEVSKASSGAVTLNLTRVDISELLTQLLVEYEERLAKRSLDVRYHAPNEKVYANLDPQKTYRIFANLLGNISKYAMPNSRVYIDVAVSDQIVITFKNISEHEINFNKDEIVERFTRGDMSRNSEGSGLGLSIADSFTQLQKGTFDISLDADLFTVIVSFPLFEAV